MSKKYLSLLLVLCMLGAFPATAETVDWSQWDFSSPSSETSLAFAHEATPSPYEHFLSAGGFRGGTIPLDAWIYQSMVYAHYEGWKGQRFNEYLTFLFLFGYRTVSDIQLNDTRVLTLTAPEELDAPRVLTLYYVASAETLVTISDEAYHAAHPAGDGARLVDRPNDLPMTLMERRAVSSVVVAAQDGAYAAPWFPESRKNDENTVSLYEKDGTRLTRYVGEYGMEFMALRLRVDDTAKVPSPDQATYYLSDGRFYITALPLCLCASEVEQADDSMTLTALTPERYQADAAFWLIVPVYDSVASDEWQLFVGADPTRPLNPETDLVLTLPALPDA